MLKKEITYTDFNGDTRTDTLYFNMTQTELAELDIETGGVLKEKLTRMIANQDAAGLAAFFKAIIIKSYGEKSDDGRYFEKGEDFALGKRFAQSAAFDKMFVELLSDETGEKIQSFIFGIVPSEIAAQAKASTNPVISIAADNTENN